MIKNLHATPIIANRYWLVEKNGIKFATLRKNDENRFVLSNEQGLEIYDNEESLTKVFGDNFFTVQIIKEADDAVINEVHGFPSSTFPHNPMFDIQRKLPLFNKSTDSKSLYCAGYYTIKYDKAWAKSFCPKLITLQRYDYCGPFKTEIEMKKVLANVSR
jgi:hypothetical protein